VVVAAAIGAIAVAVAAYLVWSGLKTPPSLAGPAPVTDLPVTAQPVDDARDVQLAPVEGDPIQLESPVAGRVTSLDCERGQTWAPGGSNLAIDGQALVNLDTSVPLWRDIEPGAKGADVEALQAALTSLGFDLTATGRFDLATRQAVAELLKRNGRQPADGGTLAAADFFWLPPAGAMAGQCALSPGQTVQAGDAAITTMPTLAEVRVKDLPADLVSGPRVLEVDGLTVPVDGTGAVTGAEALTALTASASYQALANAADAAAPWGAVLRLAEPVTVYPLPPSAIEMGQGADGCVQASDGTALPVTVVASQMGRSFVAFPAGAPPEQVRAEPDRGLTCG
jgi:peptidoglycan hydrolase-like protein with peptidoglycan-binding domain